MSVEVPERVEYRTMETRPKVLAEAFRKSRDKWKQKCQDTKAEAKKLRDRIRDLEASRAKWRDDAEFAREEQQRLVDEVNHLKGELVRSAQTLAALPQDAESEKK